MIAQYGPCRASKYGNQPRRFKREAPRQWALTHALNGPGRELLMCALLALLLSSTPTP